MTPREWPMIALAVVAALIALVLLASTAEAQSCAPRAAIVERLSEKYGEARQVQGLEGRGGIFEVWGNPDTGSWTATLTLVNGQMCIVGYGTAFSNTHEDLAPAGLSL